MCGRTSDLSHDLEGFIRRGAAYWPGANHFLLLERWPDGQLTGDAQPVCTACVEEAARKALKRLQEASPGTFLDLVGEGDPEVADCALCGCRV